jgi:hypothetical protein
MLYQLAVSLALAFAIVVSVRVICAHGETPDEWFKLVIELQKQERCLYGPDRAFLQEMVNTLTVSADAMPAAWQQRWLRALRKECKL